MGLRRWNRDGTIKGLRTDGVSWVFRYALPDGTQRGMSLGLVSDLSVEEARRLAVSARQAVRAGHDPLEERRARLDAGPTLGDLVDGFIKSRKGTARESTLQFYASLRKKLKAYEGKRARGMRQADVAAILDSVEGTPTRNRLLSLLRASFHWGLEREAVLTNPAVPLSRAKEPPRDRCLGDGEVGRLLVALDTYERSGVEGREEIALGVLLLLLTGQRVREVLDADLREFRFVLAGDRIVADWTIPASRRKTRKAHLVPLPGEVVSIIQRARGLSDMDMLEGQCAGPLVKVPDYRFDWCERLIKRAGLAERWTLRDLRRTCATKLAAMGVDEALIALILGHSPLGVTGRVYARHARIEERREALRRLCDIWLPMPSSGSMTVVL